MTGHEDWIWSVAFSPDGRRALSGSADKTMRHWDLSNGKELRRFSGHTQTVTCVALSADGKRALSGSADESVRFWNADNGQQVRKFTTHTGPVYCVCFSRKGQYALSAGADKTLRLWDLTENPTPNRNRYEYDMYGQMVQQEESVKEVRQFVGHSGAIYSIAFAADGKSALTGGRDCILRLWDLGDLEAELQRLEGHTDMIQCVALSPDGKHVLTAGHDRTIRVWDVQKGRQLHRFIGHTHPWVKVVLYLPDGKRALSGGNEGVVRLWTVDNAKEIRTFPAQKTPTKAGSTGAKAPSGPAAPAPIMMSKAAGGPMGATVTGGGVLCLAVSPDSRYFLAGSADKTLKLWELETGKEIRQYPGHQNGVSAVAISPDGKKAVSGCLGQIQPNLSAGANSRTIRLFDVDTGKFIRSFNGHQGGIWGLAFSPDGNQFVSCGEDSTVRLWDVQTAKEIRRFSGHTAPVLCVTFSSDGKYLLSGGRDKSIRLWNAATGQELRRFEGHRDAVTSLVISRDGQVFLSGSQDRTARTWRLASSDK